MKLLLEEKPGNKVLLLGNEGIVRGALEAGVEVATAYPGTPSSEIADTFYALSQISDVYFEYSTNEKVALEVAAAAAISGMRAICSMKHVGLNVAADPLNTVAYTGVRAGLVIVTADDPSMHSSQNEQDNRFYAKLSLVPMLEPADPTEAQEVTRAAFALSEELEMPVLLRTTTRVNHTRGVCTFDKLTPRRFQGHFEKDFMRWVPVPLVARGLRPKLIARQALAYEAMKKLGFDRLEGEGDIGIITAGVAYAYVKEVLDELDAADRAQVLKITSIHPLPRHLIEQILSTTKKILVVEELEPYLETEVKAITQEIGARVEIHGKGEDWVPRHYELSGDRIRPAVARILDIPVEAPATHEIPALPGRPPLLCAGCTHRTTYYAVKSVADMYDTYYASDIGCYTLGLLPPLATTDSFLCMGGAVTMACGASINNEQPHVAFIGDSTFYHSGITGLVNAVHNRHNLLLVILDNSTTAMTGHQPHPSSELVPEKQAHVDLEQLIRGIGVTDLHVVDPNDLKNTIDVVQGAYSRKGVRVIISRRPCPLFARRVLKEKAPVLTYRVNQDKCKYCGKLCDHEGCGISIFNDDQILRGRTKILASDCDPMAFPAEGRARKHPEAPCTHTCPASICVTGYMALARAGRYAEALALIRQSVPIPRILGRICHRPCESNCVRGDYDDPISINGVKRFLAERETREQFAEYLGQMRDKAMEARKNNGGKVAVIGAGPGGIAAAWDLNQRGYEVTIFDREKIAGGMLIAGLPAHRMPRALVKEEIDGVLSTGIKFTGGKTLGRDFTVKSLLDDGFEAVCLAIGAHRGMSLGLAGEDEVQGVEEALSFLHDVNIDGRRKCGRNVIIVGGGDAASDAARVALRLGAESSRIVYRRSEAEMPMDEEELRETIDEGVEIQYLAQPVELLVENGKLVGLKCVKNELGEPDESGRHRPVPIAGSEFVIECDHVIPAIGQTQTREVLDGDIDLGRDKWGAVPADIKTGATNHPRVFAAGDCTGEGWTVIDAIAQGRKAAYGIDQALSGNDAEVEPIAFHTPAEIADSHRYRPAGVSPAPGSRAIGAERPGSDRCRDFEEFSFGLTEEQVLAEAERCLSCGQCARCNNCIDNFGCPAIYKQDGRVYIDEVLCTACGVCAQLCPNDAIEAVEV
ncbi:MAG: indolepyruvate ferredoxin oxidoreductase subunit alpha [Phycisphaerales bacterium]|nr:MAG: indolepyruvate ferredoxin oxidoreductase subunit alpha [Phycisphaerales bacterium]